MPSVSIPGNLGIKNRIIIRDCPYHWQLFPENPHYQRRMVRWCFHPTETPKTTIIMYVPGESIAWVRDVNIGYNTYSFYKTFKQMLKSAEYASMILRSSKPIHNCCPFWIHFPVNITLIPHNYWKKFLICDVVSKI